MEQQPQKLVHPPQPPPQQPPQNCPRCDSINTKFCYYNNYSLTQPRFFCKACRRYWTQGGTLRNVPVGGGCRKGKKPKTSSSSNTQNQTKPQSQSQQPLVNLDSRPKHIGDDQEQVLIGSFNSFQGGGFLPIQGSQSLMMSDLGTGSISNLDLLQGFDNLSNLSNLSNLPSFGAHHFYQMSTSTPTTTNQEDEKISTSENQEQQQSWTQNAPFGFGFGFGLGSNTNHQWSSQHSSGYDHLSSPSSNK